MRALKRVIYVRNSEFASRKSRLRPNAVCRVGLGPHGLGEGGGGHAASPVRISSRAVLNAMPGRVARAIRSLCCLKCYRPQVLVAAGRAPRSVCHSAATSKCAQALRYNLCFAVRRTPAISLHKMPARWPDRSKSPPIGATIMSNFMRVGVWCTTVCNRRAGEKNFSKVCPERDCA
jgi:hypothetical protein